MDIRTVAEIDAQTKEEEDNKIKFFEDGLWVYRKTRIFYLYEIYQAYLDEEKFKTNRTKQKIVFKILDITGKGSVLPRQLDGCKLLYQILVKYDNEDAQLIMLEMVWRKILSVADNTDGIIRMSARTGHLFDSTDDNYKDKYTNKDIDIDNLNFLKKGNEFLNRSERNPFYYKPLVRVAIDEIINRNINKYTDLLNKQSAKKGGKKSRKQRIKSKRTGKSIKHNKK
jgi:hypothetical protein